MGSVESQGLLFPEVIEFSTPNPRGGRAPSPAEKLGFHLEDFGGTARVAQSVPRMLAKRDFVRVSARCGGGAVLTGRSRLFLAIQEEIRCGWPATV